SSIGRAELMGNHGQAVHAQPCVDARGADAKRQILARPVREGRAQAGDAAAIARAVLCAGLLTPHKDDRRSPAILGDLRSKAVRGRETRAQQCTLIIATTLVAVALGL